MIAANINVPERQTGLDYAREWRRRNKPIFDQVEAAGEFADTAARGRAVPAIGLVLAAIATLLAALACADPARFGGTAIAVAMLLYAGSAVAFFRADNPGRGSGAGGFAR